ncbi:MAG TPA: tRNA isopentenyl-2-thiomethyl-A-37 hydroxylase MiaE [Cellvibrionaceae bacterium]|nr:tRNA isopentenyl-2-thiomethyl-A-37 hydroxylase MiaE [Cellvibrionaceae bacterium]HMW72270.1 tRNA isopentenyl-2-thiomethyl-A-37 hydroxylase MiaE [Cellvibrionaceae bacterium]HNG60431.1 tRNA isopentenyl-2-thiomethyl-A-37 hydroxylase MiaE [Cellvibrionaceae bacterium]
MTDLIAPIRAFLLCATPDAWVQDALARPELMLLDHANCELKAAQTAMGLIWKYGPAGDECPGTGALLNFTLMQKMSRLIREEMRHFEQVIAIMHKRKIAYEQLSASRYAAGMRKDVRTYEPARLVDVLIVGAIIEARSCERFDKIAPFLDDELKKFYLSLLKSEARHFQDYLALAKAVAPEPIDGRVAHFLAVDRTLVLSGDGEFRFHSGLLDTL